MNILFLSIAYPDVSRTGNIYTTLVDELAKKGHNIRVVAPVFGDKTRLQKEGNVDVLRVHSGPLFNTGFIRKGLNTVLLCKRYQKAILDHLSGFRPDWVVTSTPPITLGKLLRQLRSDTGARCYLILRDIFPQNAKDLGLITNPLLFRYFRHKERLLYKNSDIIGCMSQGNIRFVQKQDPDIHSDMFKLLPNWINTSSNSDCCGDTSHDFRAKYGLEGKFIALFGGNFGKPQRIDFILELAVKTKALKDVAFVLIGNGTEKNSVERKVKTRNLRNVYLFDHLPQKEYQAVSRTADVGLVTLSEKFTIPNIPSRTLGYWDSGLPILAATDSNTDYKKEFLDRFNAGLWSETGDLETFYSQFLRFYNNRSLCASMGANGRQAVIKHFSVETIAQKMLNQMKHA